MLWRGYMEQALSLAKAQVEALPKNTVAAFPA